MKMDKNFRSQDRDEGGKKKAPTVEKTRNLKKAVIEKLDDDDEDFDYGELSKKDSILNYYDNGEEEEDDWHDDDWEEDDEDWEDDDLDEEEVDDE